MKNEENTSNKNWIVIDATNIILGRLASKISVILTGKNKITYAPNKIVGAYVIVININKITLSGKKIYQKVYYTHSGYPGKIKKINIKTMLNKNPIFILKHAVKGMLPKNKLNKILIKNLKIYPDNKHPHNAQQPKLIGI